MDDELHTWFNDQARTLQASLYGRRMYELMAGYWPVGEDDPSATDAMREFARIWKPMPKIVFSSSLEPVDHNARLVRGDVATVLADLRREFDGDLGWCRSLRGCIGSPGRRLVGSRCARSCSTPIGRPTSCPWWRRRGLRHRHP